MSKKLFGSHSLKRFKKKEVLVEGRVDMLAIRELLKYKGYTVMIDKYPHYFDFAIVSKADGMICHFGFNREYIPEEQFNQIVENIVISMGNRNEKED